MMSCLEVRQSSKRHPRYNIDNYFSYDVAIVTTKHPLVFSASLVPVCLPWTSVHSDYAGLMGQVLGLGHINHNQFPETPMIVNVTIHSDEDCQNHTTWLGYNQK